MKSFISIVLAFFVITSLFAQKSDLGFNYQAVIRGVDGFVIPSKNVELRFSLFPGQHATTATWVETHKIKTDEFGTVRVIIGKGEKSGGTVNAFSEVDFSKAYYWLKIELIEGSKETQISYTELPSVPYAKVADNAFGMPIGTVVPFAGDKSKVPDGWLLCDGSEVNRSEYANLYDIIGVGWGHGNNSTTFNLPDMRGTFLRGVSEDSNKDEDANERLPLKEGGNSGNNVGSYQNDAIRNIIGNTGFHGNRGGGIFTPDNASEKNPFYVGIEESIGGYMTGIVGNAQSQGVVFNTSRAVPTGTDNRPKNVYVNYIIKY